MFEGQNPRALSEGSICQMFICFVLEDGSREVSTTEVNTGNSV